MDELTPMNFFSPPEWSIQMGLWGRNLVIASAIFFAIALIASALGKKNQAIEKAGRFAFLGGALGIFGVFGILATLFVENRFEYEYVWGHADTTNAVPYRIAGIWSGQEGSFLLWGVSAAIFGLVVARFSGKYRRWFTLIYSAFLGAICGILAYESPFNLILVNGKAVVPPEGVGLAPSLQNYWVIIHPPTIFLGFGSLTVVFALSLAAMMMRDYDDWLAIVRPWSLISLTLVGLGLCMGGFWAYETLGWGGFWMWDPVENVSFVPWCLMAAFVHGVLVQSVRKRWRFTNLLLGGLPFLAFMYGTFLTRSGVLADASVHSFAEMDRSALQILLGLTIGLVTVFVGTWIWRLVQDRKTADTPDDAKGWNRESFYRTSVMLLIGLGLATLIGMSVPLLMAIQGKEPKVVEEQLYHFVVPWMFIPLMFIMAVAPFVSWRGLSTDQLWKRFYTIMCVTVAVTGITMLGLVATPFAKIVDLTNRVTFPGGIEIRGLAWIMFLVSTCILAIVGNVWRILELRKAQKLSWGPFVSHMGLCVLLAGLIISRGFEKHGQTVVMEDHPGQTVNYAVKYKGMTSNLRDRNNKVRFEIYDVHGGTAPLFTMEPGYYNAIGQDGQENPMVWPAIKHFAFHDFYFTLHPPQKEASNPLSFKKGETKNIGGITFTFLGMERKGEAGVAGTRFGARFKVEGASKPMEVLPEIEIGLGGPPIQHDANLDDTLRVTLSSIDAATGGATIQLNLQVLMYPIEIYHKPFTILVWAGTAIMAIGGFMSAWYRRNRKQSLYQTSDILESVETVNEPLDLSSKIEEKIK